MADEKLTDRNELTSPVDGDWVHIVDVSDTTDDPAGTSKKIKYSNLTQKRFVELRDVQDSDYLNKIGYVPRVISAGGPPYGRLRLEPMPDYTDFYGANAVINPQVAYLGGLSYNVFVSNFIVNGILYNIPVSRIVTLSNGDGSNPRIDLITVEVTDPVALTATITVIEGTPASSPIKPVADYETQAEITFRYVNTGETTDPNVSVELIYNENTGESSEWDNQFLLTDGDLDATDDPYDGTKYAKILDGVLQTDNRVVWDNDSEIEFKPTDKLVFAMKSNGSWDYYAYCQVKLINSTSGEYSVISLTNQNLEDYGFFDDDTTWQLVVVPLNDFLSPSENRPDYDRIEFKFDILVYIDLDFIQIQSNLPILPTPSAETLPQDDTGNEIETIPLNNHEGYFAFMSSPSTNATFTTGAKLLGGQAFIAISTTGKTVFPTVTGARLLNGDFFEASQTYIGHLWYDGTNINLRWNKVGVSIKERIGLACSDETSNLTTGASKLTFRMPYAMILTEVRANVNTAPTGSTIIVDINESGSTILSTKLSIDATEKTSTTASTPAVISDANLASDAEITIDIDQIGSTIAGKGLKVWLIGYRA